VAKAGNAEMRVRFSLKLLCAVALVAVASAPAISADTTAAKEKAEMCTACHGEGGISQTENIPSLAAQPDQFIQWQLVFFRGGGRTKVQLEPIAERVTKEELR
jgi:cytochrome c553